jgi:hypothetical protein
MRYFKDANCWFSFMVLVFSLMTSVAIVRKSVAEEAGAEHRPHMTKAQREMWRACMASKGFVLPTREQRESGEKPEFTDDEKARFKTTAQECRSSVLAVKPASAAVEPSKVE